MIQSKKRKIQNQTRSTGERKATGKQNELILLMGLRGDFTAKAGKSGSVHKAEGG